MAYHMSKGCCNTFLERSYPFSATRELSIKNINENIRKSDFNMFKKSVKTDLLSNVMNADLLAFNDADVVRSLL